MNLNSKRTFEYQRQRFAYEHIMPNNSKNNSDKRANRLKPVRASPQNQADLKKILPQ